MTYLVILVLLLAYWGMSSVMSIIRNFIPSEKRQSKLINKLSKILEDDRNEKAFNRQNYGEAFADNFARMYGYGPQLMSGLQKLSKSLDDDIKSWFKREEKRERSIYNITLSILSDEHKTDIHRINSLLNEYKADIEDPNTPPEVKKMLEDDMKELRLILDKYLNNMSDFQNKVNTAIANSLDMLDDGEENESDNIHQESTDNLFENINYNEFENFLRMNASGQLREYGHIIHLDIDKFKESGYTFNLHADDENYISESTKAYEKLKNQIDSVTSSERNEFYKLFGKSKACSLAKDKDGFFVTTHRARSKSYLNIKDIPKKDVNFVRSTS